jgi:hypothetical protein
VNRRNAHGCWIVVALCMLVQAGAGSSTNAVGVSIPDITALRMDAESRWPSLIGREMRISLFGQIEALTWEHLRVLSNTAVRANTEADASAWSRKRAGRSGIRAQERAIIAGILMQTDMLNAALAARDPARAETLRTARTYRRVQKDGDRIFGDSRDNVFCFCVDAVQDVAALQAAIGGEEAVGWPCLSKVTDQKDAEKYLLDSLTRLADQAKQLR